MKIYAIIGAVILLITSYAVTFYEGVEYGSNKQEVENLKAELAREQIDKENTKKAMDIVRKENDEANRREELSQTIISELRDSISSSNSVGDNTVIILDTNFMQRLDKLRK